MNGLAGVSAWLVYNRVIFSLLFLRRFNRGVIDQTVLIERLKECETIEEYEKAAAELTSQIVTPLGYSLAHCVDVFKSSDDDNKRVMILECLTYVELSDSDVLRLTALSKDANGMPISKSNINNLTCGAIIELVTDALIDCSNVAVDFSLLTDDDKKALGSYRVDIKDDVNETLINNPNIETGNMLSIAVKKIITRLKNVNT